MVLSLNPIPIPSGPRSTLEEMLLESMNLCDEKAKMDVLPSLPQRPTSKARLPSAARNRKVVKLTLASVERSSGSGSPNGLLQPWQISDFGHHNFDEDAHHTSATVTSDSTPSSLSSIGTPAIMGLSGPQASASVSPMECQANASSGPTMLGASFAYGDTNTNGVGIPKAKQVTANSRSEGNYPIYDDSRQDYLTLTALPKQVDCVANKLVDGLSGGSVSGRDDANENAKEYNMTEVNDFDTESNMDISSSEDDHIEWQPSHIEWRPSQVEASLGRNDTVSDDSDTITEDCQTLLENGLPSSGFLVKENLERERSGMNRWRDVVSGLKKNSRVWCLNHENKWTLGIIESINDEESILSTSYVESQSDIHPQLIKFPSSKLLPANPAILEGVDDLIQLSYLNEPAVLHNIYQRYVSDKIYTRAGPVLIAVNPFKDVALYTEDLLQIYNDRSKDNLDPHVYNTAESAYYAMMKDGVNQSIIISGESGAGKTETAKIAMQYLAAVGGGGGIENEILQTNPILEAFGNAKTLRNDNSSRFGKLVDIYFDSGKISKAKIQTYLLEKSRVVHQTKGERSYHIFYQLCAGANDALRESINLRPAKYYRYLNQSDCLYIDNVDDASKFNEMLDAMSIVQISKEDQQSAFAMLAAVLWLGNITFSVVDSENHVSVNEDEAVRTASNLLKCSMLNLMDALCTRKIIVGNEKIIQKLTHSQAADSRDALAKAIYAALFDWLVDCINSSLGAGKCNIGNSISILDIYGFESFAKNSFEQLCINYANERLQQYFNRHLFKLEQEEYISEGIDWTRIEFEDNQDCLELIEKKPLGLIALLDEECTFPKGTDHTLAEKLKEHLAYNGCFKGERSRGFRVKHYAGEVTYDTMGFLEKNRDLLHSDLLQLLSSCEAYLPQLLALNISEGLQKLATPHRRNVAEYQKQSVAMKFKGQLHRLMQRLENTEPHFIRCIKPNTLQQPNVYQHDVVLQQLRCCGILEVVRISRCGYPTRISHQNFAHRYGLLLSIDFSPQQDMLNTCIAILHQFRVSPDTYQVGYTKLFFRAGQVGRLEDCRRQTLHSIVCFQKMYRGYKARCYFKRLRKTTIFLQSLVRSGKCRRVFEEALRKHRAAVQIQKYMRCRVERRKFLARIRGIILIQSAARGWLARRIALSLRSKKMKAEREKFSERGCLVEARMESEEKKVPRKPKERRRILPARAQATNWKIDSDEASIRVSPSYLAELQNRALVAESALRKKEEDNAILQQRLNHSEAKWAEYESKMCSMEEMWQKQMSSLQASLTAAKKSLASEDASRKHEEVGGFTSRQILPEEDEESDWDDETASMGTRTGDACMKQGNLLDAGRSVVGHLAKELEHRTQVFDDDASFLVEVKTGQAAANLHPEEELRKLKYRFDTWKRDFKSRLRETKAILQKLESGQRLRKNWWSKKA